MLWVEPPQRSLWNEPVHDLTVRGFRSVSYRAIRILRLQGLYTVGQLADAAYIGTLQIYPAWLQEEALRILQVLRPALERETRERRSAGHARRERMIRLDWAATVIGRRLSTDESAWLAGLEVQLLDCVSPVKHFAWYLNAGDALDAAILDRERLLAVRTCGPARVEMLRTAIERALRGERRADDSTTPPDYLCPMHSVAGRSLLPLEVASFSQEPVSLLPLSARAVRAVVAREIETCLDLAATLDRDLWSIPGCGRRTFQECQRLVARRLGAPIYVDSFRNESAEH